MKIFFIRHGESENNVIEAENPEEYYYLRILDPQLTNLGIQQASILKERLKLLDIDRGIKYCSYYKSNA